MCGNSLVIAGLAANLESHPNLRLHRVNGLEPSLAQQIAVLHPDVVIFDLTADLPDNAFLLLQEQPQLLLIGIDLNRHEIIQWTGQHAPAQTAQDVMQTIQRWAELKTQSPIPS
ncbi:MAG TPA: hypothetical protein PKV20_17150 [Anaerolineae bacterium]|nr:hypothetical protein [Anaerolineae bacterium]